MRLKRVWIVAALLLAAAAPSFAGDAVKRLIERGDRFYAKRAKGNKWCEKAIECYEKALAIDSKNVTAAWKIGMTCFWLGSHTEGAENQAKIYKKGIDVTKRAVAIAPENVEANFWLGVGYGTYGTAKGIMNSLGLIEPVKKQMLKVIELAPDFEGGAGYRVLAMMYHRVPDIAGGSDEKAVELLKKSLEIGGGRVQTHLFLGEVYLEMGEDALARKHFQACIDAPITEHRRPENIEEKARAKRLMDAMKPAPESTKE